MLNRNKIGSLLGQGGQGAVYKYNTNKVVKISRKTNTNKNNRFKHEHYISKKAGNMNIGPKVYNIGNIKANNGQNYLWYTMNLLSGKPIKQIANKQIYKKNAYNKVKRLHNAGISHFNLHEDNIFITNNGRLFIIDYGASGKSNTPVTNNQINKWLLNASKGKRWYRFYEVNNRKLLSNRNELIRIFGP
jgi:predicted Ser/Thr protein kinase